MIDEQILVTIKKGIFELGFIVADDPAAQLKSALEAMDLAEEFHAAGKI